MVVPAGAVAPDVLRRVRAPPRAARGSTPRPAPPGSPRRWPSSTRFYHRMKYSKYGSESIFGGMAVARCRSRPPSTGSASATSVRASCGRPRRRCAARSASTTIMWGSDYPHIEGSHPHTREHLRLTFAQLPVAGDHQAAHHQRGPGLQLRSRRAGAARRAALPHQGRGRGHAHRLRRDPRAGQGLSGHESPQPAPGGRHDRRTDIAAHRDRRRGRGRHRRGERHRQGHRQGVAPPGCDRRHRRHRAGGARRHRRRVVVARPGERLADRRHRRAPR